MALTPRLSPGTLARLALLALAAYYALWGGEYSAFDLRRLQRERADERARLAVLRHEVDSLRLVARRLESDPAALERIARERFGMIREGELLYRFVPAPAARAPAGP